MKKDIIKFLIVYAVNSLSYLFLGLYIASNNHLFFIGEITTLIINFYLIFTLNWEKIFKENPR